MGLTELRDPNVSSGSRRIEGVRAWVQRRGRPGTLVKWILVLTVALAGRTGFAFPPLVTDHNEVIGITMPLYGMDKGKPAALLHVGKASIGAQRQGFFRIGILPQLVLTGVEIEFKSQPPDARALGYLAMAFGLLATTQAAELHDIAIVVCGQPVLVASRGELAPDATMRLSKVVLHGHDAHSLNTATLCTTGKKSGEITYDMDGVPHTENLFLQ